MRVRLPLFVFVMYVWATASAHALKQPVGPEIPTSTPAQSRAVATDIAADPATNHYFAV